MKTAPKQLKKDGRKFWLAVTTEYEIVDAHHLRLLEAAAEQVDRLADLRVAIHKQGVEVINRFGEQRANPLLAEERAAANTLRLLTRELGLDSGQHAEFRGPRGLNFHGA